ncbi:MAG: heparinase II/III domain-containing protein [Pirellulaceae bacterium]
MRKVSIILVAVLALPHLARAGDPPRIFAPAADVVRIRAAIAENPKCAQQADLLAENARAANLSALPALERSWWETARTKPWQETYPQIFHHTWIVPARWADMARTCAWAGVLKSDTHLSDKARQVLLALSEFTFEFEHFDVGMNYTVWAVEAMEAYELLYDSYTPSEREKLDAFFHRFLAAVKKNDEYWVEHEPGGRLNNHYAWHKLAFVAMGLFYRQSPLVDEALDGPKGIQFLMQHGFTDEGLWLEGSIPYQFAATIPLVKVAELLENADHPRKLYDDESGDGHTLRGAYDALLPLLFPDQTLPTIGDCYGQRRHVGKCSDWEILYRRFRDPRIAWLLQTLPERSDEALLRGVAELPEAEPPVQVSRLWPEHGYAALRSTEGPAYWTGSGWSLFATYSSHPVHENSDKLSIILFADGHLWLPDCEALPGAEHSFSAQIQRELNRQTLCHNTLLIDDVSQSFPARPLELVEYRTLPAAKRFSIGDLTGQLYPDVRQLRTCVVRAEYVLDFFQVQATAPHDLKWLTHVDGVSDGCSDAQPPQPADLKPQVPWRYLRSPQRRSESSAYWEMFRHEGHRFRMDLMTRHPQEIVACDFPRDEGDDAKGIPMRIFRSQQSQAWYAAVYRCGERVDEPLVVRVMPGELQNWRVEIELAGQRYVHRVPQL